MNQRTGAPGWQLRIFEQAFAESATEDRYWWRGNTDRGNGGSRPTKKGRGYSRALTGLSIRISSEVHSAAGRHGRSGALLLRQLGDHRLGGDQEAGN